MSDLYPAAHFSERLDRAVLWLESVPGSYARMWDGDHWRGERMDAVQLASAIDAQEYRFMSVICYAPIRPDVAALHAMCGGTMTPAQAIEGAS
jgi:inosine/xanthosine triphosphate pyrophosphatase family protein